MRRWEKFSRGMASAAVLGMAGALLTACAGPVEIPVAAPASSPIAEIKYSDGLTNVRDVEITGYRKVPGRTLSLEFTAGDPNCEAVALMEMKESQDTIAVRVKVGSMPKPAGDCTPGERTVVYSTMLKVDLGERKVLAFEE